MVEDAHTPSHVSEGVNETLWAARANDGLVTVAAERIEALAYLARVTAPIDEELTREYVRLARQVAERNRLSLPKQFRRFTCDVCDIYRRPGVTARVRLQDGHVVTTCDCGAIDRFPYGPEP
jgi:ribonuclease P protein subunit RPR2